MNPFWLYNIFQGGWFNHQPDVVSSNKTNGDTKSRGLHVGCLFVKLEPWNFLDIDPAVWWILGRLEPPHNQWCLENPSKMIPWWSHVVQMLKNAWNLTSKKNRSFRIQSLRVLEFKEPFHTFLFCTKFTIHLLNFQVSFLKRQLSESNSFVGGFGNKNAVRTQEYHKLKQVRRQHMQNANRFKTMQ